ncbi:MAG: hypothetical protein J0I63_15980 [Thiobacillus sp.]|nr:hypothetical protein [Thiobacillus sp.]
MIRTLAAAGLLLTLAACGALPAQPDAHANRNGRSPTNECEFDACPGNPSH